MDDEVNDAVIEMAKYYSARFQIINFLWFYIY